MKSSKTVWGLMVMAILLGMTGCASERGLAYTESQVEHEVLVFFERAYDTRDFTHLVPLLPTKMDIKAMQKAYSRPEGASKLKYEKLPSNRTIEDSVQVYFDRAIQGLPGQGISKMHLELDTLFHPSATNAPTQLRKYTLYIGHKSGEFVQSINMIRFNGRTYLSGLDVIQPK